MERYFYTERGQNKLQILNQIMSAEGISATEICERTKLSAATVSRVFKEFRNKGLVTFQGKEKTEKGRSPDLYSFNWEYGFVIHYYISSKEVYGYIADLNGTVLGKTSAKYSSRDTLDDFLSIIKIIKKRLSEKIQSKKGEILAAGFSIPGVVNEQSRTIISIPNVHQLDNTKFFDYAEQVLEVPVIANNVSWLSAVGEKTHFYPFASSLVYIVITPFFGIGAGIICQNELIKGSMHYAGEIGQLWFDQNHSLDEYIQGKGLYEQTASISRLFENTEKMLHANEAPILKQLLDASEEKKLTLAMLEEAAKKGDKAIEKVLDDMICTWAVMIININLILNPEFIVLGGYVSTENHYIYDILSKHLKEIKFFQPTVQLSISGEDAQLYGGLQMLKQYVNDTIIFKQALRA